MGPVTTITGTDQMFIVVVCMIVMMVHSYDTGLLVEILRKWSGAKVLYYAGTSRSVSV